MPNSHFENLPNEILLKVLHYLETQDLIRVSLLSQRIRPICHDETLWQTMNIHNGKVPIGLVELILNNGCKHLRFSNAELVGNMKLNKVSQLRYLVLQDCKCIAWDSPNEDFLETLMASCNSLENVSMNKLPLSSYMLKSMCHENGNSLRVLNLEACRGYSGWKQHPLDLESVMIITSNCVNLKEVNFAKAQISESAINYLVENLTPNLEKLSLLCQSQITDKHVWALVNRCNKLCTLVLRNTCTTDASVTDIIEKLESTLEELDIHRFCYGYHVKPDKLFQLRKLPKFKVLNYSGASPDEIENLRRHLKLHNIRITDIKDQKNEGEISVAAAHKGQCKLFSVCIKIHTAKIRELYNLIHLELKKNIQKLAKRGRMGLNKSKVKLNKNNWAKIIMLQAILKNHETDNLQRPIQHRQKGFRWNMGSRCQKNRNV